jgi:hypothetical protein
LRMLSGTLGPRDHVMRRMAWRAADRVDTGEVEVPDLVGMIVADARRKGHEAGLVVVSADPDGPLS